MVLLQMQKHAVSANLLIPLPESGLPALTANRLITLHFKTLG
jgi:hypothetical protein